MTAKKLIVLIVLCAAVFITFFIISRIEPKNEVNTQEPYLYVDQNATDSIRVFTFDAALEGEVSFTYSNQVGWCLDHSEKIPLDDQKVRALISGFSTIVATKRIDEPSSELSEYGLDKPSYSVSIKISGKIKHYYFGKYHETLRSYYFKAENSDQIWLVPETYIEDIKISVLDLLNPNEIPDLTNIQSVEFTSVHGVSSQINKETEHDLISALSSMSIDYAVGYGEEDYSTFSLDKPALAVIEYLDENEDQHTLTLCFGRGASDKIAYVLSPDTSIICVLKCENIAALLSAMDKENT